MPGHPSAERRGLRVNIRATGEEYYRHFRAICKLAKATKVVTLVVPSSELGTPFNEEVERLRRLVDLAALEGARVGMKTTIGCLTEDPDTAVVLCDNVKGLGLTLDPSHYVCGPHSRRSTTKLMKYVYPRASARLDQRYNCRSASARAKSNTAG